MFKSWTGIGNYFGLRYPFDFAVAIPFLLNTLGLFLVLIYGTLLFADGELTIGTERFYFFMYIIVFLITAAAVSRTTIFSLAFLCWCAIDLGLAISTEKLEEHGIGASLFPRDTFTDHTDYGFIYHPLLQGVPKPNWKRKSAFAWAERVPPEVRARYPLLNWSELTRERTYSHNSLGLRGAELEPNDLKKDMIFVYGGSTTYDISLTQGSTWVERLQSELNNKLAVLNLGVPGYGTTEHLIQTAFYQNIAEKKPVCAIYYIGWNDIRNAHIEDLDRAYANFHLPSQISALGIRKRELWAARYSALARLANDEIKYRFDSLPEAPRFAGKKPVAGTDRHLETVFLEHVNTLVDINDSRGIKTVFIGQVLNREQLISDGVYGWLPLVRDKDVWALQEHFNQILESSSASNGAKYIDAGIDNFTNDDFVDNGHFSIAGARKFARVIFMQVASYCQ